MKLYFKMGCVDISHGHHAIAAIRIRYLYLDKPYNLFQYNGFSPFKRVGQLGSYEINIFNKDNWTWACKS